MPSSLMVIPPWVMVSALEAEAVGLLESLKMAISNGLCYVIFERESKSLMDALKVNNILCTKKNCTKKKRSQ